MSRFHQSVRLDLALLSLFWCVGAGERARLPEAARCGKSGVDEAGTDEDGRSGPWETDWSGIGKVDSSDTNQAG